eukprot:5095585-Prymnesium_polylepis.2
MLEDARRLDGRVLEQIHEALAGMRADRLRHVWKHLLEGRLTILHVQQPFAVESLVRIFEIFHESLQEVPRRAREIVNALDAVLDATCHLREQQCEVHPCVKRLDVRVLRGALEQLASLRRIERFVFAALIEQVGQQVALGKALCLPTAPCPRPPNLEVLGGEHGLAGGIAVVRLDDEEERLNLARLPVQARVRATQNRALAKLELEEEFRCAQWRQTKPHLDGCLLPQVGHASVPRFHQVE